MRTIAPHTFTEFIMAYQHAILDLANMRADRDLWKLLADKRADLLTEKTAELVKVTDMLAECQGTLYEIYERERIHY